MEFDTYHWVNQLNYKNTVTIGVIIAGLLLLLQSLGNILLPFFISIIGAYILNCPVTFLQKLQISRGWGSFLVISALILLLVITMIVAIPLIQNKLIHLAKIAPNIVDKILKFLSPLMEMASAKLSPEDVRQITQQISNQFGNVFSWGLKIILNLLSNGMALANTLSLAILTPIVMFYLVKDWPKIVTTIDNLLPKKYGSSIRHHMTTMDNALSSYAKGQSLVCFTLIILYSIGLLIINLDYAIMVGVFTGLISFVPYLGALIGFLLSVAIALQQFDNFSALPNVMVVFLVIQAIEGYFLTPRLVGEQIGLHPVWMIFALLAGITWFGFIGVIFALPTAAIISILIRIIKNWYEKSYT